MAEGNAITVKIGAETDGIEQGIRQIQNSLKNIEGSGKTAASGFDSSFAKMAGAVAVGQAAFEAFKGAATMGLSAVTGAVGSLVDSFTSSIDAAAQMETLATAFTPLLGSAQAAQDRIAELAKFAAETPFEMPEIAKASKTLETLTRGALSTSEGLRLVGDVASATNTPFEEISTTIGRLYDGLQSGRPVGEVMQRLQELGAVSGDTRSQIEALSKEGKNTEAWLVAENALNRFSGSMKLQSGTWSGLLSTLNDNITQALAKFGMPIIDRLKPYLQGVIATVELVAEKAANLGTTFAENFIASSNSAKTFQKAVDAISTGQVEAGFSLFWENLKLQAMETGDNIYKTLKASFQTAADFIGDLFSGNGPLLLTFEQFGKAISEGLKRNLFSAIGEIGKEIPFLGESFADSMSQKSQEAAEAVNLAYGLMKFNAGKATEVMADQMSKIPDNFKKNFSEVPPLFDGIAAQQARVEAAQANITTAANATTAAHNESANTLNLTGTTLEKIAQAEALLTQATVDGNTQLAARLEKNLQLLNSQAEGEAAAARAKALSLEIIELETALNEAKALGNEELTKSLEKQLEQKKATEEIAKLTEEYQKTLGVNANEAARLANNFVNAKNAANSIADRNIFVTVTTKVSRTEYDELMASINAGTKDPKTLEILFKTTGKTDFDEAYKTLQNMQAINKNFDLALKVSGAQSLEELWQNLNSIPTTKQIQLGMQITGKDTYDEVVRSLPSVAGTKTAKLILEQAGFENTTSFINTLKGVPDEKRTKLIVESLGVADVDAAKAALDSVLVNDGKKATIHASADTASAESKLDSLTATPRAIPFSADFSSINDKIDLFSSTPQQLTFDTGDLDSQLREIKAELQNNFTGGDGGPGGSGGEGGLGGLGGAGGNAEADIASLQKVVETIKGLVEKIEPRLPVAALSA